MSHIRLIKSHERKYLYFDCIILPNDIIINLCKLLLNLPNPPNAKMSDWPPKWPNWVPKSPAQRLKPWSSCCCLRVNVIFQVRLCCRERFWACSRRATWESRAECRKWECREYLPSRTAARSSCPQRRSSRCLWRRCCLKGWGDSRCPRAGSTASPTLHSFRSVDRLPVSFCSRPSAQLTGSTWSAMHLQLQLSNSSPVSATFDSTSSLNGTPYDLWLHNLKY